MRNNEKIRNSTRYAIYGGNVKDFVMHLIFKIHVECYIALVNNG